MAKLVIALSVFGACFVCACLVGLFWPEKEPEVDPVLPSELDDWDAEFTRLTGKSIWQARCEADPELRKSVVIPGSAQNNINPYHDELMKQLMNQDYNGRRLTQAALAAQMNTQQQRDAAQLSGLLGGLGNIGGLFH
jgi:hypothetical protein